MRRLLLCVPLILVTAAMPRAQGISPETRAWLSDTLVVLMDGTYSLDHARDVIATVQPDLMDWHFGIYGNIGDVYRRSGVRVSGGAWQREYQEYVTWYDRDWRLRMQQFDSNGVGRLYNGDPVWDGRARYCASMCHNAPKWHTWHNQGLLMPVGLADTISQDNIDVAGFVFGRGAFCRWCLSGFRDYLGERFTAGELAQMGVGDVAQLDFAEYLRATHPERGPEVLEDPLCREYLKYQHIAMLDHWRDLCRKVRGEAARQGVPIPPIYGNQYGAQTNSFGLHQSTEVDVVWIEDGLRLPTAANNHAWSALRYTVGRAAGGRGQPVWSCLYPPSADARLTVLSEALANGGVHVANSPSPDYQEFARFVRENRHLFTRREPVARVGLIASPTTWMWGQFPGLGLRESRTRELFAAAARALHDAHVPCGAVVFHHPDVVDERPCLAELDRYQVIVAAGVECLSEGQEAALRRFTDRGGRLVTVGDLGIYDEDHVRCTPPDLPGAAVPPELAESLLAGADADTDVAAIRSAFADAVAPGLDERLISTDAGPLVWVSLWQQRGRRLDIHLVNYDMPSGDLVPTEPCQITVALPDGLEVSSASMVGPEIPRQSINLRRDGDLVHLAVPAFRSYAITSVGDDAEMQAAAQMALAAKAVDRLRVAGQSDRAEQLAADLADADRPYTEAAYQVAEATARRAAGGAAAALAESVARALTADADERAARVQRGRGAALALDFGPEPTDGWRQVTAQTAYDVGNGFGWLTIDALADAGGTEPDALHGDRITSEQPSTLRVDLAPGAYRVSVITGELNESYHWGGDIEVAADGRPVLVGITRRGGVWRSDDFVTEVTDGALQLTFSARPAWWPMTYEHEWSVAGLIIEPAPGVPARETLPLTEWLVSGPYDDGDWTGIQAADALPSGRPWHSYAAPPGDVPIVDFRHLFTAGDEAMFCATTALIAEAACEGELHLGLQARGKVWLNGELILHDEKASGLAADEYVLPVSLRQGPNVLEVLTSTDWIGASMTASLLGGGGVTCSVAQLPQAAAAGPVAEYPEPAIVLDGPTLTLGVPTEVSVQFRNPSDRPVELATALSAPDAAEKVTIEPLDAQQPTLAAPGETAAARYRVTMTAPVDSVYEWHGWSLDVPDTVKLVATVRCGEEERTARRWVPARSPRLEATVTRAATAERPAELEVELANPTDAAISGPPELVAPDGWMVAMALPATLAAEPGQTASATATLQPGDGVVPGEYAAHVTVRLQAGGGQPVELQATTVVALVGIAGQWYFDEGEGTVATDASANHNDGTVQPGVARAPGHRGQALRFDGSAWVEVPHSESLSITSGITVEAWVNPETFVGNDMIVVKTDYANEYLFYADAQGTLHGRVRMGGSGRQDTVSASDVLEPGVWQHIAFTWNNQVARLYHNGALVKEIRTQRPAIGANTAPLRIGGGAYNGGFHGLIDEVTVRTGALGPEDIRAFYEQER